MSPAAIVSCVGAFAKTSGTDARRPAAKIQTEMKLLHFNRIGGTVSVVAQSGRAARVLASLGSFRGVCIEPLCLTAHLFASRKFHRLVFKLTKRHWTRCSRSP